MNNVQQLTQKQVESIGSCWACECVRAWMDEDEKILDTQTCVNVAYRQRQLGDYIAPMRDGKTRFFEVKTERRHTGNLFLETFSNLTPDSNKRREGWMKTLDTDLIAFVFLDAEVIYWMDFRKLQNWGLYDGNMYRVTEKAVHLSLRGEQLNLTIGHPVPVKWVAAAIKVAQFTRDAQTSKWMPAKEMAK